MGKTFIELESNDLECDNQTVVKCWAATEADFMRFVNDLREQATGEGDTVVDLLGNSVSIEDYLNFQSQLCGKIVWDRITDISS